MFNKFVTMTVFILSLALSCKLMAASEYQLPSGEVLKDPTRPQQWQNAPVGQTAAAVSETFTLNYILSSGAERRAMINGKKLLEGEQVSGATVKRIERDKVIISYQGKRQELRLNSVKGIQRH